MSIRGTVARLERTIAAIRAKRVSQVWFRIIDRETDETAEAYLARVAEAEREAASFESRGGVAFLMVIGDEGATP
ncbi:hypothetical protein [Anaeromyxobacter dehalogenans]|uniref:Uncharacterized protein n=1 Tax=Anaeromyxobacter dehalogenans (strain 2CP-C) TaxID=290397 RepID=Q2IJ25_ANADE|nr:hypothetical protein [Anaeromyxobacter dehalogenans]ABC81654.1 hypothetical protein Adeh_1883 [Anaeromyxobacter dehalogenans 2CP-C]